MGECNTNYSTYSTLTTILQLLTIKGLKNNCLLCKVQSKCRGKKYGWEKEHLSRLRLEDKKDFIWIARQ